MVNFEQFQFDKYFWLGKHEVPWLAPQVTFIIHAEQSRIPDSQREIIQFVCDLPPGTRAKLEAYLYCKYTTEIYGSIDPVGQTPRIQKVAEIWRLLFCGLAGRGLPRVKSAVEIWKLLSQPGVSIPPTSRIRPDRYFTVSFECLWDEEHGIHVLFNNSGDPIAMGGSGSFF